VALDGVAIVPAGLPVVLAGPVVRKLTDTAVSVWVALRAATDLTVSVQLADGTGPTTTATATPTRIGQHVWAVLVTVAAPGGAFGAGALYGYTLNAPGWVAGDFALAGQNKPTFLGLPASLAGFRILHASCRRPHGNRRDGLVQALPELEGPSRPAVLFLSGDQIYADDVATALMARIRRVATDMIGIDETGVFGALPSLAGRQAAGEAFGLTSGAAGNHLWTFGEFVAHYLLAWSDVLWPANLPAFASADPGEIDAALDQAGFDAEVFNLQRYRDALPEVRKVLANIPVFMIFDDHEVTDDFNLNHRWCKQIYGAAQGRRTIANGLLAYFLFQHWGNVPGQFGGGSVEQLTLTAATFSGNSPIDATMELRLGLPVVVPDPLPAAGAPMRLLDGTSLRYDHSHGAADGYPCNLVFLDERTVRFWGEDDKPAGRIGTAALNQMWPAPVGTQADTPTVVVAPAPMLGLHLIEHVLQPAGSLLPDGDSGVDFEAWTSWRASYENVLTRIAAWKQVVLLSGDVHFGYAKDLSYTVGGTTSRAVNFVSSGAKYTSGLTLTLHLLGDAMMKLGLIRDRTFHGHAALTPAQRTLLQSPPPNGSTLPYDDMVDVLLGRVLRAGQETPAVLSQEVAQAYAIAGPDWQYSIKHVDDETAAPPGPEATAMASVSGAGFPWTGWDRTKSVAMIRALRASDLHRIGRVLVGLPQLARISFSTGPLVVSQDLLVSTGDDPGDDVITTSTSVDLG